MPKPRENHRSVTFPIELMIKIKALAIEENRNFSQMVVTLCLESIKNRENPPS
jgi:hypothetical protein